MSDKVSKNITKRISDATDNAKIQERPNKIEQYKMFTGIAQQMQDYLWECLKLVLDAVNSQWIDIQKNAWYIANSALFSAMSTIYPDNKEHFAELEYSLRSNPIYEKMREAIWMNRQVNQQIASNLWNNIHIWTLFVMWTKDAFDLTRQSIKAYTELYYKKYTTNPTRETIIWWVENMLQESSKAANITTWEILLYTEDTSSFILDEKDKLTYSEDLYKKIEKLNITQQRVWCPFMRHKFTNEFFMDKILPLFLPKE